MTQAFLAVSFVAIFIFCLVMLIIYDFGVGDPCECKLDFFGLKIQANKCPLSYYTEIDPQCVELRYKQLQEKVK